MARTGKEPGLNRFVAKLVKGSARLAFWRKRVDAAPEQPQPPVPETSRQAEPARAETPASADVPRQPGWFARLGHTRRRRKKPAPESTPDVVQTVVEAPPSRKSSDASATADAVPPPKPSLLARLKNTLRRQPGPEQVVADTEAVTNGSGKSSAAKSALAEDGQAATPASVEPPVSFAARLKNKLRRRPWSAQPAADEAAEEPGAEKDKQATASSDDDSADDADAPHVSRIGRVLALLSNKWVWIPSVSMVILAFAGTMTWMLVQSKHEREQLQVKLASTQKQLKQVSIEKQVALRQPDPRPVGVLASASVGSAAATQSGVDVGDCDVSSKESVAKNLKNCIEAFNNSTAR
jgi:hypothetical protein